MSHFFKKYRLILQIPLEFKDAGPAEKRFREGLFVFWDSQLASPDSKGSPFHSAVALAARCPTPKDSKSSKAKSQAKKSKTCSNDKAR